MSERCVEELPMTDLQSAVTRLRTADEQNPDFWNTLADRDADPQMLRDVVEVARAYVRKVTLAQCVLRSIQELADSEYAVSTCNTLAHIANKAAEGLGE